MKYRSINKIFHLTFLIIISSCQSDYTKLVKSELKSGVKNDVVFYGLKFGQSKNDFFRICWDLNRKKIATHGPSNNYVQVMLNPKDSTQLLKKIRMLFYAKFNDKDTITAMDIKFSYEAWAPWNKDLGSDKLIPVIKDTLLKWYPGNPFIKVNNILVKVDGNRQIEMKQDSERDISVLIEDLAYKYKKLVK